MKAPEERPEMEESLAVTLYDSAEKTTRQRGRVAKDHRALTERWSCQSEAAARQQNQRQDLTRVHAFQWVVLLQKL